MLDMSDPEDRLIRNLLVGAGAVVVLGILTVAVAITVMVSANFNFLQWLE
jgi:hypothetical protein